MNNAPSKPGIKHLDGRWGTGKTTFVKQWIAELRKLGVPSIYFDAFANDYIDSPFEAVAAAFVKAAIDARQTDTTAYRNFLNKAASVGRTIGAVSAKVGIKAATMGAISAADAASLGNEVVKALADGIPEVTEAGMRHLLEQHATKQGQFADLRRALADLPNLLRPNEASQDPVPILVFIDELDRCRPDFSLGVLKTLKHFFRADNVHFVLVTNRAYLELTVANRYGVNVGANEYLQKFYDFIINFDVSYERYSPDRATQYIEYAIRGLIPDNTAEGSNIREALGKFSSAFRLSLRQMQALVTHVAISHLAANQNEFRPPYMISYLATLKVLNPELYRKVKLGSAKWQEHEEFVTNAEWEGADGERILEMIRYYSDPSLDMNDPQWRSWGESMWRYNVERHQALQVLAVHIMDRFGAPTQRQVI